VPVFVSDIKGDLSGMAVPGEPKDFIAARAADIGQAWSPAAYPLEFYSLGGVGKGVPLRTTVTDFGPLLMAKVLGLNATQESSLSLIFHWADKAGLALLDLIDLRAAIQFLTSDEGKDELKGIGGVSSATAGVILREISALEAQGAEAFFGEPAFDTSELLRVGGDGRGVISALELPALQDRPALFSTFLMWLLAELFEELPEVGDLDKPKLVFFFDEAHLLFTDASRDFLTQVTQTVRLIRSKGVGVFFVTQTPKDVPADVLAQLGSRVQHALRAFTPDDERALRASARTFPNSPYDLEEVLTVLGTGEAIVTVLSDKGAPTPVAWTRLRAPRGSMEVAPDATIDGIVAASPLQARYGTEVDRESAYELLAARAAAAAEAAEEREAAEAKEKTAAKKPSSGGSRRAEKSVVEKVIDSGPVRDFARTAGREIGRGILRGIFGTRSR
jgi:DNA helicase HerA-like ATPase